MAGHPDFTDPDKWKVYRHPDGGGVNVFVTHTKTVPGEDGKSHTIRFDKARLQKIVERNNKRDAMGQHCPLSLGHTVDGKPESEQPDQVGYARDFELAYDKKLGKWVIRSVLYVDRDHVKEAEKYKRISVEIYPKDNVFDPISLLKRTPQLDLGQWTYGKGGALKLRYAMDDKGDIDDRDRDDDMPPPKGRDEGGFDDQGRDDEGDDKPPPREEEDRGPADVDPDFHGNFMKCMKHYKIGKYAVGDGLGDAPDARRVPPRPPARPEDRSSQMRKDGEAIRYARLEQRMDKFMAKAEAAMEGLSAENKTLRYEKESAVCERIVTQLQAEGYMMDPADEVEDMIPMTEDQRTRRVEKIRKYGRKAPVDREGTTSAVRRAVGSDPVRMSRTTANGETRVAARGGSESGRRGPADDGDLDETEQAEVLAYMRENNLHGERGWAESLKAIRNGGR